MEKFLKTVGELQQSIIKLVNSLTAFEEAVSKLDLPDFTIQENLAAESILNNSLSS